MVYVRSCFPVRWLPALGLMLLVAGCALPDSSNGRVPDQRAAEMVAQYNVGCPLCRVDAVAVLENQALLQKLALHDGLAEVRAAAVKRVADGELIARVAVQDPEGAVRCAATERLTDQGLLRRIEGLDSDVSVRRAALARWTDQAEIDRVALEEADVTVRLDALARVTDMGVLAQIEEASEGRMQSAARARLFLTMDQSADREALAKLQVNAKDEPVRERAAARLKALGT